MVVRQTIVKQFEVQGSPPVPDPDALNLKHHNTGQICKCVAMHRRPHHCMAPKTTAPMPCIAGSCAVLLPLCSDSPSLARSLLQFYFVV